MSKIVHSHKKWNYYFLHLNNHTSFGTLENIVAIRSNGNEFTSQYFNIHTYKSLQSSKHELKHIISCPLHFNLFHTNWKWDSFPSLNNINVKKNIGCIIYGCHLIHTYKSEINNIVSGLQQQIIH
jgi:hypothetical protein